MSWPEYILLFAAMGLVTYLPRWLPLVYLAHKRMPKWLVDWLSLIPVAILSSLLAPSLLVGSQSHSFTFSKTDLWVALPTLLFALKTKSLGGTLLVGMLLFWLVGMLRA